ncbi:hypothetical protein PRZ48_008726 [Zasmidium cellare]|uniref:MARVEL domain-containing protein n=1 Tax=Zasmidium cellare TaxID=395010 RepID=A0ABR0EG95_ZASCE|nr:hypothetical protein PRZ48_008726 [Zasmidium cellare]
MEGSRLGLYVTRAFQLIFAIIALGVSAHLAAEVSDLEDACNRRGSDDYCDYFLGRLPESSAYAAFTGAFGTLAAIVGLVAAFVSSIPWVVALVFDVLATIFFLAGGINSAVLRGDGECKADFCREWTASTAFMFLGFFASLVAAVLVAVSRRSGGKSSAVLCAIVVIGLSLAWIKVIENLLHLYQNYYDGLKSIYDPVLSSLKFDLFAGAFALVDVALTVAASFLAVIPCLVCIVVDALSALFLIAGGLATVVIMKKSNMDGVGACDVEEGESKSLCTKLQADAAFLIIGFLTTSIAAALFFLTQRRKKGNTPRYPAIQHGVEL